MTNLTPQRIEEVTEAIRAKLGPLFPGETGAAVARELAEAALSALPISGPTREEVARIIDPQAWRPDEELYPLNELGRQRYREEHQGWALRKADQILALLPHSDQSARIGELERALREVMPTNRTATPSV
jgi:hypothetical protein